MSRNAWSRAINAKIEPVTRRKAPCFIDPVHSVRGGSCQLPQLRLRLQPEAHVNLTIHRPRGGQVLAGLLRRRRPVSVSINFVEGAMANQVNRRDMERWLRDH